MRKKIFNAPVIHRHLFLMLTLLLIHYGCNKDKEELITQTEKIPLSFSALKFDGNITRVTGNDWDNGDEIGIFAHQSGNALTQESLVEDYANYTYTTSGNGRFYSKNKDIYYPDDKNPMNITAYYPFTDKVTNFTVPIDITEQKDFLYSNNLKELTKPENGESKNYTFNFNRILSNLSLSISAATAGASLEELSISVSGAPTEGSFSLSDGRLSVDASSVNTFGLTTTGSKSVRKVSAVLFPAASADQIELTFKIGSAKLYSWKVPHALEAGKKYSYNIKLNHTGTEIVTQDGYMEIPNYAGGETAPNSIQVLHIVDHNNWLNSSFTYDEESIRNYTALYDKKNRVPYWVAFPLHPIYMDSGNRTDDWAYDPQIPEEYQPNLTSGWKTSNLDRGHLMASADRSASYSLNRTTFYFSNITPQNSTFNQRNWEVLESKVRNWSKETTQYDTLYVVTGVILPPAPAQFKYAADIDGNRSVIPEYFYKALLRKSKKTNEFSSVAFLMENDDSNVHYSDRVISVAELEKKTGFTFFPNLHPSMATEIKTNASLSPYWN